MYIFSPFLMDILLLGLLIAKASAKIVSLILNAANQSICEPLRKLFIHFQNISICITATSKVNKGRLKQEGNW